MWLDSVLKDVTLLKEEWWEKKHLLGISGGGS
jgi:hypothetical protein